MASIELDVVDSIAFIRLNRPEKYNAFNREMALLLQSKLDECKDPSVRAVCITGNGKAFSSGQDLEEVVMPHGPVLHDILKEHYNPIVIRIRELEKPVVAAVNGVAAGAGANIALSCDIVIATESSSFIQAFSKIGLIPDSGGTFFLPRLVGFQKASAWMMLGEKITAKEAETAGMVFKVHPDESFEGETKKLLSQLASMPTKGLALTKKALNQSLFNDYRHQLHVEEELQVLAGKTTDYSEGVNAFIEKRKPNFKGE